MVAAEPVVELADVSKVFGSTTVVDGLTLAIDGAQIFGMIGPSGCGKTTTIRLMLGVLVPTAGTVRVMGVEPSRFTSRHRERMGYTPQGFILYPNLTVIENARFVASLFGVGLFKRRGRIRQVLQFLELWDARHRLAKDISGGMQRRLSLACALLHRPSLLFVDEPTAGLDPILREKIWGHLRTLRDEGTSVLVTTQYIDEAAYCDRVAILNRGTVAAVGTPEELRRSAIGGEIVDVEADRLGRDDILAIWQLPGIQGVDRTGPGAARVTVDNTATAMPAITNALAARGRIVDTIRPHVPGFDEVFMKVVKDHG